MNSKSKIVNNIVAVFLLVIVLSASIVRINIESVSTVSNKTENLVNQHISHLEKISELQNLMNQLVINLHSYYANIDSAFHEQNLTLFATAQDMVFADPSLFESVMQEKISQSLDKFKVSEMAFHQEMMKASARDWDRLREHLYASQESSNDILGFLHNSSQQIKIEVKHQSEDTLAEILTLNQYQTIFVIALVLIFIYIIFVLNGRIKDQQTLFQLAYFDPITSLPNKARFEQLSLNNNTERTGNAALIIIELDRYKLITGRFGYLVGERYLQAIAETLSQLVYQQSDALTVYQFTSTSWLLNVEDCKNTEELAGIADKLLDCSASHILVDDLELAVSFSIGISIDTTHQKSQVDLIREADAALNVSIEQGGNCYHLYSDDMGRKIKQYVDIDHALRHAIPNNELSLFFQPKVLAQSGETTGSEVLLRWIADGKIIGPNIFIPIAEKSGLILEIGNWVLKAACQQWRDWQKQGLKPLPIAVNISAVQFQDPNFPTFVANVLTSTDVPANMLELEITEEAAAIQPEEVIRIMNELKAIGVGIAIDDFGTGYSSLSYLKRFPVDVLKIDRSFVNDMSTSDSDANIVKLIFDLAKQLNYQIVAEGVETEEQYRQLKAWQCDYIQGYYFSKPLSADDYTHSLQLLTDENNYPLKQASV